MEILHLTLKKKWFDMIASGEKKEEYREIKPYWIQRLHSNNPPDFAPKKFDFVHFRNGYSANAPELTVRCLGIETGQAKPNWSDGLTGCVYIIKLGDVVPGADKSLCGKKGCKKEAYEFGLCFAHYCENEQETDL